MTSEPSKLITSLDQLSPEQASELVNYVKAYNQYVKDFQQYQTEWTRYCTEYYNKYGHYPNTTTQTPQTSSETVTTSLVRTNVDVDELAKNLNLKTGKSIIFSVYYKTTPTGKEMSNVAFNAVKKLYPEADVLKKQSSDPKLICSIILVSLGGTPFNSRVWAKEHGIERHYTDTNMSDEKDILKALEEAVKSAASLRDQKEDKEYEYYSRILSE